MITSIRDAVEVGVVEAEEIGGRTDVKAAAIP
jgi:hypothetical protein